MKKAVFNMKKEDVTLISKKNGYNGFFEINCYDLKHKKFAGGETPVLSRECFERGHAVGVLAYDPKKDKVVLLEQFRVGAFVNDDPQPWLMEIIAGIIEPGESVEEVAHREAMEESGCTLLAMEPICHYYVSPGGTSETLQLYCACVNSEGMGGYYGVDDEGEDIKVHVVSYNEAVTWLQQGRMNNASTIITFQWLMLNKDWLRDKWKDIF